MTCINLSRFLLILVMAIPFANAASLGFMKDTIVVSLSDSEMNELRDVTKKVLNSVADKKISTWVSPNSAVKVQILPTITFYEDKKMCRRTAFKMSQKARMPETYRLNVCKDIDDEWRVTQIRFQPLVDSDVKLIEQHIDALLDEATEGKVDTWLNSKTNISGTLVVVNSKKQKTLCHQLAIALMDQDRTTLEGAYWYCKTEEGWKQKSIL